MNFFSNIAKQAQKLESILCIGLDPHPEFLTELSARAAQDYCLRVIEATAHRAVAYKPNSAFFELYGAAGIQALIEVIKTAQAHALVILDAKRGDIASTSQVYAQTAFHSMGADAITVNPYLGADAIAPFIASPKHGVFLLCKTSNPGAQDFQDLPVLENAAAKPLFVAIAEKARKMNQLQNVGLVVGATHPDAIARIRNIAPELWFLVPGIGAQGGDLAATLKHGLNSNGQGILISVSRSIAQDENPKLAVDKLYDKINQTRKNMSKIEPVLEASSSLSETEKPVQKLHDVANALIDEGCVRLGRFTLKSGQESPIFIDLRRLVSLPKLLAQVAESFAQVLRKLSFDHLAPIPYGAFPIATAISLQTGYPMVYPRREPKNYGTGSIVEGLYDKGQTAVLIDDVTTTGASKLEAISKLNAVGLKVKDVVVFIDRSMTSEKPKDYQLHSVFSLTELVDFWQISGRLIETEAKRIRSFLNASIQNNTNVS